MVHRSQPGVGAGTPVETEPFTYTVHDDIGGDVLILAAEDVTGLSPVQGLTSAQFVDEYASSLDAAGFSSDVYDFDVMGRRRHTTSVCSRTTTPWSGRPATTSSCVRRGRFPARPLRRHLTSSCRSAITSTRAARRSSRASTRCSRRRPMEGTSTTFAPPECTTPGAYPCLPILNDFQQYWLGAYVNISDGGTDPSTGEPYRLLGVEDEFAGFTGDLNAAGSAANQDHTALLLTTSSFLPPDEFPQFASAAPVDWAIPGGPFDPHTGEWYVYSQRADVSYKRLTRTIDLTGASSGETSRSGRRTTPSSTGTTCSSRCTRWDLMTGRRCRRQRSHPARNG